MKEARLTKNPSTSAMEPIEACMNEAGPAHDPKRQNKMWRKVNVWSIKGPLLVLALLLGFLGGALDWNSAPFAAGVAITIPIIGFRDFWAEWRFWITIVIIGAFQVPLVILVRPLVEQLKFPFLFTFGIFDCVLVVLGVSWVCSQLGAD